MKVTTIEYYATLISSIKDYIDANANSNLSIEYLSKRFTVSPFHLCRIFKASAGVSLNRFVVLTRLNKAVHDVVYATHTMTEIAFFYGFNDYETFSRNFKKHFKVSPNDLRDIMQQIFARNNLPPNSKVIIKTAKKENELKDEKQLVQLFGPVDIPVNLTQVKFVVKRKKIRVPKKERFIINKL